MKYIWLGILLLVSISQISAQVDTVIVNNESGMDVTVLIEYTDDNSDTHIVLSGERKPFYTEEQCIYSISVYSQRWENVSDISPDDKLVIPEGWNRCQGWEFTIQKRKGDGTPYIARKKGLQEKKQKN